MTWSFALCWCTSTTSLRHNGMWLRMMDKLAASTWLLQRKTGILMSGQLKYYATCSFCGVRLWLVRWITFLEVSVIVVFPFFPLCCQQTYLGTRQILCKFGQSSIKWIVLHVVITEPFYYNKCLHWTIDPLRILYKQSINSFFSFV